MKKSPFIGLIALYFIIGLEVLIMISPFAGFFYSVYNPFLLEITKYPSTRWLGSFFLPHLVVPPDGFLKFIRVMGSVLFAAGIGIFLTAAFQVYRNKFLKKGAVLRGLYSVIRHPQYAALGLAGLGLSILWPRFITAVLWPFMFLIYYLLAKDEERRMLKEYATVYRRYMENTGMFLPRQAEAFIMKVFMRSGVLLFAGICIVVLGGAFLLREYTLHHLPIWTGQNVTAISILPEDRFKMEHRMDLILQMEEIKTRLNPDEKYLVYFLPAGYIMQGLLADTGEDWKLYKKHHSLRLMWDWVFHPFRHLEGGHHHIGNGPMPAGAGVQRRLVFLKLENAGKEPLDAFSTGANRIPVFSADIEIHGLALVHVQDLPQGTGWGKVPVPIF